MWVMSQSSAGLLCREGTAGHHDRHRSSRRSGKGDGSPKRPWPKAAIHNRLRSPHSRSSSRSRDGSPDDRRSLRSSSHPAVPACATCQYVHASIDQQTGAIDFQGDCNSCPAYMADVLAELVGLRALIGGSWCVLSLHLVAAAGAQPMLPPPEAANSGAAKLDKVCRVTLCQLPPVLPIASREVLPPQ